MYNAEQPTQKVSTLKWQVLQAVLFLWVRHTARQEQIRVFTINNNSDLHAYLQ